MERRPTALSAPVRISTPPGNSLLSTVLPLSRERRSFMVEVLADAARYVTIVLLVLLLLGLRERVPTITGS
jgi:hypothetical protein